MHTIRKAAGAIALTAVLLLAGASPASAHEVRYGANGGLGGNVFYSATHSGTTYCAKGSGWMNHPGASGTKARSSATTWFRRGSSLAVCSGSSSLAAGVDGLCLGNVSTAIFRNGLQQDFRSSWAPPMNITSWTATLPGAGLQGGTYSMQGSHRFNSSWPGSCSGSTDVGQSWTVSHNL